MSKNDYQRDIVGHSFFIRAHCAAATGDELGGLEAIILWHQ